MCSPIRYEGLSFGKISTLNQALLGNWLWRFGGMVTISGGVLVAAKYGELGAG